MKKLFACLALLSATVFAEAKPWSISVSSAGGVTGGGSTTIIRSNGDVVRKTWSRAGETPKEEVTGQVNSDSLDVLQRLLENPELRKIDHRRPSNMSRTLTVQFGDGTKSYTVPANAKFPAPVQHLNDEFARALKTVKE